ncbi:tubulin-specific chaperone cofactor E-like protein [Watersipora subatra]|uniref:tubulin-specific chaperone cofactor E-like protein n=1 Tax=Watersipora subatra TaxID=2589382 RepID=UPI00355BEA81
MESSSKEMHSVSLVSALKEKYSTSSLDSLHCEIFITSKAPGKTVSGNFRVPKSLMLDGRGITSAGDNLDISQLCSDVVELDLAQNNIQSWQEVWTILEEITGLEFLNLTRNPLPQLTAAEATKSYPFLKNLVLNFTGLTWETISNLLKVLPNLEELYLSGNSYKEVTLDIPAYDSLRLLQLTDNNLSGWRDVQKLDELFPRLETLVLALNNISSCGSLEGNVSLFSHLSVLNMNNTAISEWDELDKLSAIKSVTDIRLASIPLVEAYDEIKRRQMILVYFAHASRLNGSSINTVEIDAAERVYIRHFQDASHKPCRYAELQAKHGVLDPLASVTLQPADTVAMTVVVDDKRAVFDIPTKQTIGQLKSSLRAFVGARRFKLFHDDNCLGLNEIKTNNRFVWALNFRDGETLVCDKLQPTSPTGSQPTSPRKSAPSSPFKTVPGSPMKATKPQAVISRRSQDSATVGNSSGIENIPPSPSKEPPLKKR